MAGNLDDERPFGLAQSCHIRIDGIRVHTLVHFEHAPALDAGTLGEPEILASSDRSFMGPNVMNNGAIQMGVMSTVRTSTGMATSPV